MKRILITFSGAAYDQTTERIITEAPRFGVDEVRVYDDRWLMEQEFFTLNQWLWAHHGDQNNNQRGFGWFAWKPFILMHALERCPVDGDIVMYLDADTFPIEDLTPLYSECSNNGGIMLFEAQGCWHANWCKRDCLIVMAQDEDRYRLAKAGVARFALFQKGPWRTQQFLAEWLTYCLNPLAQTFDPSRIETSEYNPALCGTTEYPELKEHRTEQAIMTNLAHKYGIKLYREASQEGNTALSEGVDAWYGQLFEQLDNSGDKRNLSGSKWRNIG